MLGRKHGLLFNDGQSWKAQRRYALKTLKDFGFGKKGLEGVLVEEADRLADQPILCQSCPEMLSPCIR